MSENIANYVATVKFEVSNGTNKDGTVKTKWVSEQYLVTNTATIQDATEKVKKDFERFAGDWKIVQVKESKIVDVIG